MLNALIQLLVGAIIVAIAILSYTDLGPWSLLMGFVGLAAIFAAMMAIIRNKGGWLIVSLGL